MIISLCIPCMNRTYALKVALPEIIEAANYSPPCEIVILDYDSKDDLQEYVESVKSLLNADNQWTIKKITDKQYYNSPHARNLSVLASHGEYIIQLSAEALPREDAFQHIRAVLEHEAPIWMCEGWMGRWIVCKRDEFIASGGYDERFYVYAPEDKDICMRLRRRGTRFGMFPRDLIDEIYTPNEEKLRNLDKSIMSNKRIMGQIMSRIFNENNRLGILVANPNGWGKE